MNIPVEILEKYNMKSLEAFKEDFDDSINTEMMLYHTFLIQTDFIPNKILEGVATSADYAESCTIEKLQEERLTEILETRLLRSLWMRE